jgi:hypothetical protein
MPTQTEKRFYTYLWLRPNGTPYYVGKGTGKRAFSSQHRLPAPKEPARIFIQFWADEAEALEMEKYYIKLFGRNDIGTGILRNFTDGGDGLTNPGPVARRNISEGQLKRFKRLGVSAATRLKYSDITKARMSANNSSLARAMTNKRWAESTSRAHSLATLSLMRAAWTPERRNAQAERMRLLNCNRSVA